MEADTFIRRTLSVMRIGTGVFRLRWSILIGFTHMVR